MPLPKLNALYERYLTGALPVVARVLSRNAEAYDYLAKSIKDWPTQRGPDGQGRRGRLARGELAQP